MIDIKSRRGGNNRSLISASFFFRDITNTIANVMNSTVRVRAHAIAGREFEVFAHVEMKLKSSKKGMYGEPRSPSAVKSRWSAVSTRKAG